MKLVNTLFITAVTEANERFNKRNRVKQLKKEQENRLFTDEIWWIPEAGKKCTNELQDFSVTGQGGFSGSIKVDNYPRDVLCEQVWNIETSTMKLEH